MGCGGSSSAGEPREKEREEEEEEEEEEEVEHDLLRTSICEKQSKARYVVRLLLAL